MLNWASRFNIFCFLDNNNYQFEHPAFDCLLAAGNACDVYLSYPTAFTTLKTFSLHHPGWLFGHFNYPSSQKDEAGFPDGYFFIPKILVKLTPGKADIISDEEKPEIIFSQINACENVIIDQTGVNMTINSRISKEQYIEKIEALKWHIHRGDCYEINFCQDFFSGNATIDPLFIYQQLSLISPNPFAALYKLDGRYCICASPERFIKKTGQTVISQPIKGTSKRDHENAAIDKQNKIYLENSSKEKSENVMIVDLVRNDLSRFCKEGSVFVKELFGIYPFPQVYQMISTIQGSVDAAIHWTDIISSCFPMGSMTGAPKIRVMELIEQYETAPRGLFSGSIGYITPEGDADFNVVIRSLFYNEHTKYLSFKAGSGITFYSDPVAEYEECMMKLQAIRQILQKD